LNAVQGLVELHASGTKRVHRPQTHFQVARFFRRDLKDVYFRTQGLPQGGLYGDAAQRQGSGITVVHQTRAEQCRRRNRVQCCVTSRTSVTVAEARFE
jgi:hypothetical protein